MKDFLQLFPRTHEDRSHIKPIQSLDANGEIESVKAYVVEKKLIPTKSPKKLYEIRIEDEDGSQAFISLFNNPWAFKSYEVGQWYIITGKVVFEYRKIIFRHPDATKTSPPSTDDEDTPDIPHTSVSTLHNLEQQLYGITKYAHLTIDEDNLLFFEYLKKSLSDLGHELHDHTDRSVIIVRDTGKYLLAPKSNTLSTTQSYQKLKDYVVQNHLTGGILYYTDENKRIKLLSYEIPTVASGQNNTTKGPSSRNIDRIYPIYSELLGISPSWIARNMRKTLPSIPAYFSEYLPEEFLEKFSLLDVQSTIRNIHFPESHELLSMAQERIYFDRLLRIQLHALAKKQEYSTTLALDSQDSKLS